MRWTEPQLSPSLLLEKVIFALGKERTDLVAEIDKAREEIEAKKAELQRIDDQLKEYQEARRLFP